MIADSARPGEEVDPGQWQQGMPIFRIVSRSNLLFRQCQKVDRIKFARMKAYYDPRLLDDDERMWLRSEPFYLKVGRVMKKRVYRMTKMRKWGDKIRRIRRWFGRRFGTD